MSASSEKRLRYLHKALDCSLAKATAEIRHEKQKSALKEIFIHLTKVNDWMAAEEKFGTKCNDFLSSFALINLKRGFVPKVIVTCVNGLLEGNTPDDGQKDVDVEIRVRVNGKLVNFPTLADKFTTHQNALKELVKNQAKENGLVS